MVQVVLTRLCGCDKLLQSVSLQLAQLQADKVCHTNWSHTLKSRTDKNTSQIFLPALSFSLEMHWVCFRNQMAGDGRRTSWRAGSIPEGFASGGAGYTQSQDLWFVIGTVLCVCVCVCVCAREIRLSEINCDGCEFRSEARCVHSHASSSWSTSVFSWAWETLACIWEHKTTKYYRPTNTSTKKIIIAFSAQVCAYCQALHIFIFAREKCWLLMQQRLYNSVLLSVYYIGLFYIL